LDENVIYINRNCLRKAIITPHFNFFVFLHSLTERSVKTIYFAFSQKFPVDSKHCIRRDAPPLRFIF